MKTTSLSKFQRLFSGFVICVFLLASGLAPRLVIAESTIDESSKVTIDEIRIGINGCFKLGFWTPIELKLGGQVDAVKAITTRALDGDGLSMELRVATIAEAGGSLRCWTRIGRSNSGLQIRLLDANDEELAERTLSAEQINQTYDKQASTRRIFLSIGFSVAYENSIRIASGSQQASGDMHLVSVDDPKTLPHRWFGYESVDTIILSTHDYDLIQQMNSSQVDALYEWIEQGGRLLMSAGETGKVLLNPGQPWAKFGPGRYTGAGELTSSKSLEFYARPAQQLVDRDSPPIPISTFESAEGLIDVAQDAIPLIVRRSVGMGEIVFVTFDFEDEKVSQWNGRTRMLSKLFRRDDAEAQDDSPSSSGGRVTHYGFEDLSGQLRAPLDQFRRVNFVTFTLIAVLIGVYLLLVGPGDYFFLRHVIRRMEFTWISFSLVTIAFCAAAIGIVSWSKPKAVQVNQVEVIDIDVDSGLCRGTIWSHIYSPTSRSLELKVAPHDGLGIENKSMLLTWQGLPGTGLGGMQTETGLGLIQQDYVAQLDDSDSGVQATIDHIPVQVGATKSISSRWWSRNGISLNSNIRYRQRGERLVGTLQNPFDRPLQNCYLLFDKWSYRFGRLEPGQTVSVIEGQERTLKNFLTLRTRTKARDNESDSSTPWNLAGTDIPRILQIMMFYDAAGGSRYTSLTNGYQDYLDLSGQLELGRAIFVGRLDDFVASSIEVDGQAAGGAYDKKITVVRFLIPVKRDESSSNR